MLPKLPAEPSESECCSLADCTALICAAFEAVAADYVDGALKLLDTDPDLCRRFHETEAAIDAAVKAGPTERELQAALALHVAVIREACQRKRAQREARAERADPMPELPESIVPSGGHLLRRRSVGYLGRGDAGA